MKVSLNWLKQFVDIKLTPPQLADLLSERSVEVKGISRVGEDYIFDLDYLSNQSHSFSIFGLAREIAALTNQNLKKDPLIHSDFAPQPAAPGQSLIKTSIDKSFCRRYSAILIRDVKPAPSPKWLKTGLERLGLRSINHWVDLANYVMLELGQPLHVFDAARLAKNSRADYQIGVRRARTNETLLTLDGEWLNLTRQNFVITDENQGSTPIALAGIKGGRATGVNLETTQILVESANFDPLLIRQSARAVNLRSEAVARFEKNLDSNLTAPALARFFKLLEPLDPLAKIISSHDNYPFKKGPRTISLAAVSFKKLLGIPASPEAVSQALEALQFEVGQKKNQLHATVPTWRTDVKAPVDLIEEAARVFGYNKIPAKLPTEPHQPPQPNLHYQFQTKTKNSLVKLGFTEVKTHSFVGKDLWQNCQLDSAQLIPLKNPRSPEQAYLRSTLIPSLLLVTQSNQKNFGEFGIFELARVYFHNQRKSSKSSPLPRQPKHIAGLIYSKKKTSAQVFFDLKSRLQTLLVELNADLKPKTEVSPRQRPALFPPKAFLQIQTPDHKSAIGHLGSISQTILKNLKIEGSIAAFEANLEELFNTTVTTKTYQPISPHTPVKLDFSITVDKNIPAGDIASAIQKSAGETLIELELFDIYSDEKRLDKGKKSLAFHLKFNSLEKQLTTPEAQKILDKITQELQKTSSSKSANETKRRLAKHM